MKYPYNTKSKPISGSEAKRFIEAIEQDKSLSTPEGKATAERILERRQARLANQYGPKTG